LTPLLAHLSLIDYGVLALYLALMVGLGVYFAGEQKSTRDYFLGGRSLGWFPLGMSLMATLIAALTYTGVPGEAYEHGVKTLLAGLSVWIVLPVLVAVVLPIYRGLGLYTVYEFLELRFDARVRLLGSLVFIVWRLVWLAWMICVPCQAVIIASGLTIPPWTLAVGLGLVTTFYTFLGGVKAVVWAGTIHGLAMLGGAAVVIAGVWHALPGGAGRVTEVASGLSRLSPVEFQFDWKAAWSLWGALPHWVLVHLSFTMADQITAQRFLCAKSVDAARTSYLANCVLLSILHAALVYIGLCLVAFYHDRPQEMQPQWVANVDNITRGPMLGPDGRPLIDPADPLTSENVEELVQRRKVLQPNSKEPFTDAGELRDPETGKLLIDKLAMRRPTQGKIRGEIIVAKDAPRQMLPQFIAEQLPWGTAGLALLALLAACMSSIDSGLNSICTLLVMDIHRRYGVGKAWLARKLNKSAGDLTEADELVLARPLTLVIGIAATLISLLVVQVGDIFDVMVGVANAFGAPLLGVFLLGMFTRRCTAAGALAAMIGGGLCTGGLTALSKLASAGVVPGDYVPHDIWILTIGTLATLVIGYGTSLVVGRRKTNRELRGLVFGCGIPGVPASEEEVTVIGELEAPESSGSCESGVRWK
jgi:Na+/proline symporter